MYAISVAKLSPSTSKAPTGRWLSTVNCGTPCSRISASRSGQTRVGALGEHPVALVQHLVEDLDALVGQADLVGVRIAQRPPDVGAVPVLDDRADLAADVLDRLAHARQQRLKVRVHRFGGHQNRVAERAGLTAVASGPEPGRARIAHDVAGLRHNRDTPGMAPSRFSAARPPLSLRRLLRKPMNTYRSAAAALTACAASLSLTACAAGSTTASTAATSPAATSSEYGRGLVFGLGLGQSSLGPRGPHDQGERRGRQLPGSGRGEGGPEHRQCQGTIVIFDLVTPAKVSSFYAQALPRAGYTITANSVISQSGSTVAFIQFTGHGVKGTIDALSKFTDSSVSIAGLGHKNVTTISIRPK